VEPPASRVEEGQCWWRDRLRARVRCINILTFEPVSVQVAVRMPVKEVSFSMPSRISGKTPPSPEPVQYPNTNSHTVIHECMKVCVPNMLPNKF
jgi:hypothetical protein